MSRPRNYIYEDLQIPYLREMQFIVRAGQDLLAGIDEQTKKHFEKLKKQVKKAVKKQQRTNEEFSLLLDMAAMRRKQERDIFWTDFKEKLRNNFEIDKAHFEAGKQQEKTMAESFKPLTTALDEWQINQMPVIPSKPKQLMDGGVYHFAGIRTLSPWQLTITAATERLITGILDRLDVVMRAVLNTLPLEEQTKLLAEYTQQREILINNLRTDLMLRATPDEMIDLIPGFQETFSQECQNLNDPTEVRRAFDAIINPVYQLRAKATLNTHLASLEMLFNQYGRSLPVSFLQDDVNKLTNDYAVFLNKTYSFQASLQRLSVEPPAMTQSAPKPSFGRKVRQEHEEEQSVLPSIMRRNS